MKILIYSPLFYPSIGGLETIIATLAEEFVFYGLEVKLITQSLAIDAKVFPFEVIRRPSAWQILRLTAWCDIFFQGCVSLRGLWPLLLTPRPLVISHHTWYQRIDGRMSWQDYLKKIVSRFATNISVSQVIAKSIPGKHTVIPNAYRDDLFYTMPNVSRSKELVFLGRLVSDKGVALILDALANLKQIQLTPRLTIIGSGPEEKHLRQQAQDLQIAQQVEFAGVKFEKELAQLLNTHQIMVVPSRWQEPFGIVALEGIACGCVVVGSAGGGLKEAIGPCGITFPNGNVDALTTTLITLLQEPEMLITYRRQAEEHLALHKKSQIALRYIRVMQKLLR